MKNIQRIIGGVALALLLSTVACQDSGLSANPPANPPVDMGNATPLKPVGNPVLEVKLSTDDLAGHWTATSDVVTDDAGNLVDFIATESYDLVIGVDGAYTFTISDKKGQKLNAWDDMLSVIDGSTLVMDGSPAYVVSLSASGGMKWVKLSGGDNPRTVEWKKAAPKPILDPIQTPNDPSI